MHTIAISISTTKYFRDKDEMAEFLGIESTNKHSIRKQCRENGWEVEFDD